MDLQYIAILLQITGIIVGTGFGTILLNPNVVGRVAHRINESFLRMRDSLLSVYSKIRGIIPEKMVSYFFSTSNIIGCLIIVSLWVSLIFSITKDIKWLFWVCISFLALFLLIVIVGTILKFIPTGMESIFGKFRVVSLLTMYAFMDALVMPFILVANLLLVTVAISIISFIDSIAKEERVRRLLIISGFTLVFAAKVIELFMYTNS